MSKAGDYVRTGGEGRGGGVLAGSLFIASVLWENESKVELEKR